MRLPALAVRQRRMDIARISAAVALIASAGLTVPIVVVAWNTRTLARAILVPYNVWVVLAASLSVGDALRN